MNKTLTVLALGVMLALTGCGNSTPTTESPEISPTAASPVSPSATATDPAALPESNNASVEEMVAQVAQRLREKHPDIMGAQTQIVQIALSPEVTMYEVVTEGMVFYTNQSVDYVLAGTLFVGQGEGVVNFTQRDRGNSAAPSPTQEEAVDGRAVFNSLPLDYGFSYTYGQPIHRIVIFEDPNCGYCQGLHQDLASFGERLNMRVTVFPYVISGETGVARAKSLVCASNPSQAWHAWMLAAAGKTAEEQTALWATWSVENAPTADCPQAQSVEIWQGIGQGLGLTATPTIMFENGMTAEGRPTEDQLRQALEQVRNAPSQISLPGTSPSAQDLQPENSDAEAGPALIEEPGRLE